MDSFFSDESASDFSIKVDLLWLALDLFCTLSKLVVERNAEVGPNVLDRLREFNPGNSEEAVGSDSIDSISSGT